MTYWQQYVMQCKDYNYVVCMLYVGIYSTSSFPPGDNIGLTGEFIFYTALDIKIIE